MSQNAQLISNPPLIYPTLYASSLITVSKHGYTKHYFEEERRICSKIGGGFRYIDHHSFDDYAPTLDGDYFDLHSRQRGSVINTYQNCMHATPEILSDIDLYKVIAEHENHRDEPGEAFYYHSDHLGSAAYLTNHGHVIQTLNYLPYGEDWVEFNYFDPNDTTRLGIYRFNGKEKDYESGFHYYGARYHWAELPTGWLSVDPQTDDLPSITPYSYCNDNPVVLKDPDGEFPWVAVGAAVGAAVRAGVAIYEGKSAREVAGAAVKGAIEGAMISSGAGVFASAAGNAVGDAAEQLIGTGSVSVKKVAVNAATNVAFGGAGKVVKGGVSKVAANATQKVEQKYASAATQKAIRKEVQAEVKSQGKTLGHATKTQVNKTTATRVQNLKTFDKKVVEAKKTVTNKAVDVGTSAAASKTANKINGK